MGMRSVMMRVKKEKSKQRKETRRKKEGKEKEWERKIDWEGYEVGRGHEKKNKGKEYKE